MASGNSLGKRARTSPDSCNQIFTEVSGVGSLSFGSHAKGNETDDLWGRGKLGKGVKQQPQRESFDGDAPYVQKGEPCKRQFSSK